MVQIQWGELLANWILSCWICCCDFVSRSEMRISEEGVIDVGGEVEAVIGT